MTKLHKPTLGLIVAAIILLSGCSPEKVDTTGSVYTATETYSATMGILIDLRKAGKLSEKNIEQINQWEPVAWQALQEWRLAVKTNLPVGESVTNFLEALAHLETIRGP